jgi:hypothetical protein
VQSILFPNISQSTRGTDPDTEDYGYDAYTSTPESSSADDQAVAPGGWGAAISHMAVSVKWAPDPPPTPRRHKHTLPIDQTTPKIPRRHEPKQPNPEFPPKFVSWGLKYPFSVDQTAPQKPSQLR